MKAALFFLFLWSVVPFGCSKLPEEQQKDRRLTKFQENIPKSLENKLEPLKESALNNFSFKFKELTFNGQIDNIGQVTILNYPEEWRGKITLVRFDDEEVKKPFSQEHCQIIRDRATKSSFPNFVRGDYRSKVSFEIPPFLSYEFKRAVLLAAQKAGYKFNAIFLKNPVDEFSAVARIILIPNAISEIIGKTFVLEESINLSRNGIFVGSFEKHLFIAAGDFLCDLANKGASIEMTYSIIGSNKPIKIIYDYMELKN